MRALSQPRRRRWGSLEAIEFPASAGSPAVVCLHGYGADAADLAGLAMELDLAGPARWIFPEAPHRLDPLAPGRAWFPIAEEDLLRVQAEGAALDFSQARPPGLDETLALVREFLDAVGEPWDRLILAGFSQGAMVALETALRAPAAPRGLALLSTAFVDEPALRRLAPARAGLRYFQSHGTRDPLLPYEGAQRLAALLAEAGLVGELFSFDGPHGIPREALEAFEIYLNSALTPHAEDKPSSNTRP